MEEALAIVSPNHHMLAGWRDRHGHTGDFIRIHNLESLCGRDITRYVLAWDPSMKTIWTWNAYETDPRFRGLPHHYGIWIETELIPLLAELKRRGAVDITRLL